MPATASTFKQLPDLDLELCILTNRVGLYAVPPAVITSDELAQTAMRTTPPNLAAESATTGLPNPITSPSEFTRLLSGPLDDFLLYSRQENSQWLMDIAHDICDPGLRRGSLRVWDPAGERWRPGNVNPTEVLTTSIYLYDVGTVVSLSKISERAGKSKTLASGSPSTMADRVKERDGQQCWVSGSPDPLVNSHVVPKRMGDHILRVVYSKFVLANPPLTLSIYDTICGITLCPNLDAWFDKYELGLRFVAPDEYECHSFLPPDAARHGWHRTIMGTEPVSASTALLHGRRAGPPQPQHDDNPPPGLIQWHYLQCVIKKFAHLDYRAIQNIEHYESSLRIIMDGDSDDEGTGSEDGWPSAPLDRGRAMQMAVEDREESQRLVTKWVATL